MYACYDAFAVYGVIENDCNCVLDRDWLEEHFPTLSTYASYVARNTMGTAVYGNMVPFSTTSGQATASDELKADVARLFALLCKHSESKGRPFPTMGYFLVVSGDYKEEHDVYIPYTTA